MKAYTIQKKLRHANVKRSDACGNTVSKSKVRFNAKRAVYFAVSELYYEWNYEWYPCSLD